MIHDERIELPSSAQDAPSEHPFLQCRVAGTPGAPLLLFLHGFPEGPFIWDELLRRWGRTHRCVAPALRGYPGSHTPAGVKAYRAHEVVGDLVALVGHPWLMFGFAGALREIGLPESDVPTALLTFNLGVEIGQLMIVTAGLVVLTAIRR